MAPIKKKQIITDEALRAPLELGENFGIADKEAKKLIDTLAMIPEQGKKIDKNLDLAKSTKAVKDETDKLNLSQIELEKIDKRIAVAEAKNNAEFIKKEKQLRAIRAESKKLIAEEDRLLGTEEKLIKANKELLQERRSLNKETEEGAKRAAEINEQINANNEALKEGASELEKNRFQVGGYREALEGLGVNLDNVGDSGGGLQKVFGLITGGINDSTKAAIRFIATPIGAILAAIVAVIASLTLVVNNNQAAADEFNTIWGGISSVLDEVFGRVVKLAGALLRFVSGDFSGAAKLASEAFDDLAGSLKRAFDEGQKLVKLQIELEKATIAATTATAKLRGEADLLQITADDATRSFKEREAAATAAREKEAELAKINLDLAARELEIINIQTNAKIRQGVINRKDEQEQADALARFIEAENEALAAELENEKVRRELKQDRLEKDLDILIDGFDNVKTINERIINDDNRTIRNRQENLDKLVELSNKSFSKQIETIKKFTKINFDENSLLAEQDAVILNQRIRNLGLSEIIEGRLLEVIRERRIVLADTAEIEEAIQQASIERLQQIADNEKNLADERIQALLESGDLRLAILDDQLSKGILNEKEFADKVEEIQNELADKINEINLRRFDEQFTDAQLDAETERIEKLIELNEQFRSGEISSIDEFERRKLQIQQDGNKQSLEEQLSFLEERKKLLENAGVDTSEIDRNIARVRLELSDDTNRGIIEKEKALQEALNDLKRASIDATLSIIDSFNEREDEKRQERLELLQEQEQAQLEAAGDNEQRKQEIQLEFAARRKAVEDEQAKANRKRAIFEKALAATDIGINTAIAVSKAIAASPLTGGLPFSAIAAALGAVQLAAVLAKPIPAFFKGTDFAPSGLKTVAERGPELSVTPSGELRYFDKPSLVDDRSIPMGSKIFTREETERMLLNPLSFNGIGNNIGVEKIKSTSSMERKMNELISEGRITRNIIKNKREYHLNISKHAADKLTKNGENWMKLYNSEYR